MPTIEGNYQLLHCTAENVGLVWDLFPVDVSAAGTGYTAIQCASEMKKHT